MTGSLLERIFSRAKKISAAEPPASNPRVETTHPSPSSQTPDTAKFLRTATNKQAIADLKAMLAVGTTPTPQEQPTQLQAEPKTQLLAAIKSSGDIGSIVRERRKKAGISQKALCQKANVGTRFMVELEAGKTTLELGKVLQVLAVLGLGVMIE